MRAAVFNFLIIGTIGTAYCVAQDSSPTESPSNEITTTADPQPDIRGQEDGIGGSHVTVNRSTIWVISRPNRSGERHRFRHVKTVTTIVTDEVFDGGVISPVSDLSGESDPAPVPQTTTTKRRRKRRRSTTTTTATPVEADSNAEDPPSCDENSLNTECDSTRAVILDLLNEVRRQARASNMLRAVWDEVAAQQAQKWADNCVFEHGPLGANGKPVRSSSKFNKCGQNLAAGQFTWNQTFKAWDAEIEDFTYGKETRSKMVGHYLQNVWATSYQIGCGYSDCPGMDNNLARLFVCHYCPSGNSKKALWTPYSTENGICGHCGGPDNVNCDKGLCVPGSITVP
ncbi:putative Cysteine-rich secretory protein 1 [Hypsibius exemplaris]|uniref:Cysteine-rich secretory protein 1 n=1 Tax=Hypsibius exemplaris TaxID=2072580 RepID=A0A1W0X595_HYPEX|nr:putative Cysteine-rich secretory protein 1 [Hypsibius exemplaris]